MAEQPKGTTISYTGKQVQELLDKVKNGEVNKPATDDTDGLMSAEDKQKLNELEDDEPMDASDILSVLD